MTQRWPCRSWITVTVEQDQPDSPFNLIDIELTATELEDEPETPRLRRGRRPKPQENE